MAVLLAGVQLVIGYGSRAERGTVSAGLGFLCLRNFFAGCIWNRTIQDWFGWEYYSLGKRYFYLADFWFLLSMLFASILFFLVVDRVLRSGISLLLTAAVFFAITGVCLLFSVSLPYNIQLAPYWAAFMLLGAYAGQKDLSVFPPLSRGVSCVIAVCLVAAGIAVAMLKEPSGNVFRGQFGENEILSMILNIGAALPFVWGIGILFAQMEKAGVRLKEIACTVLCILSGLLSDRLKMARSKAKGSVG